MSTGKVFLFRPRAPTLTRLNEFQYQFSIVGMITFVAGIIVGVDISMTILTLLLSVVVIFAAIARMYHLRMYAFLSTRHRHCFSSGSI